MPIQRVAATHINGATSEVGVDGQERMVETMADAIPISRAIFPDKPERVDWQVGVFCQNEGEHLADCLHSIDAAVGSRSALITVILNGSTDDSLTVAQATIAKLRSPAQVFVIPYGDKSNAINHYVHNQRLRVSANLYFAVDGYATINRVGLAAMEAELRANPGALAASGVAGNGRTSPQANERTVLVGGVFRGQFNCMTAWFVHGMVAGGLRLPVGLYRGDGLLGNIAAHEFDPVGKEWVNSRVVGVADAVFLIRPLSLFRLRDVRRQFNRKVRQMRGKLENAAIRTIVHSKGFAALPQSADELIRDFLRSHPVPHVSLPDRPFMMLALRQHRRAIKPGPASLEPQRVA